MKQNTQASKITKSQPKGTPKRPASLITLTLALLLTGALFQGSTQAGEKELLVENAPISKWVRMIGGRAMNMRMVGVSVLIGYVPESHYSKAVPLLIPYLKSKRSTERWMASMVLGEYGAASRSAVPALTKALGESQTDSKNFCNANAEIARALGKILKDAKSSPEVDKAVAALIAGFKSKRLDTQAECVRACGEIGSAAQACVPHLGGKLKDPGKSYITSFPYLDAVAWTCGRMGKAAEGCVPNLLPILLRTESPEAVIALGGIGKASKGVVSRIVKAIQAVDAGKVTIKKDQGGVPMSKAAARAFISEGFSSLAAFGPASAEAVPLLKQFIERTSKTEKAQTLNALKALGAIGPKAAHAASSIEKLKQSPDAEISKAAVAALTRVR